MERIIIYQLLPRLFGNAVAQSVPNGTIGQNGCGKMNRITDHVLEQIRELGISHVWYTGLVAHATQTDYSNHHIPSDHPDIVKGKAGSPYAIKDYYDIDPDLAEDVPNRFNEFLQLVGRTHRAKMKVIMDFVPNHVARQYHSLAKPADEPDLGEHDQADMAFHPQNNFYYIPGQALQGCIGHGPDSYHEMPARATGNDQFSASPTITDWYETVKLNYGIDYLEGRAAHFTPIPDTWHRMVRILRFWASKGIDGFRCDMAEMVPVEFWSWAIRQIKHEFPGIIFIAEVYNPGMYRNYIRQGCFDYLYDKVGLYDTLRAITCGNESAMRITSCWQQLDDILPHTLHFLENHDEQRIASTFFAGNPWHAIPALLVSACMHSSPFLVYAGQELGEQGMDAEGFSGCDGRTTIFDYWSPSTLRRWYHDGLCDSTLLSDSEHALRTLYQRILNLCLTQSALRDGLMFDLQYANTQNPRYNPHRQFAFLRRSRKQLLLIAVNFDKRPQLASIQIPTHAFEFLHLAPQSPATAHDLLTDFVTQIPFTDTQGLSIPLNAYGGVILDIALS